jgi:transcriptional regulator with XRE-family HTH domain
MADSRQTPSASVVAGHNLHRQRAARGLSIGQLAQRSGVSKGTLSKIESGATNPTVETLDALARALDVPLPELLTADDHGEVAVVRAGEGLDLAGRSFREARLVNVWSRSGMTLEVHEMTIPVGPSVTSATHGTGTWEHVLVLSGSVRLGPIGAEVEIGEGDYAVYPADGPHSWMALAEGPARVWVFLLAPPTDR